MRAVRSTFAQYRNQRNQQTIGIIKMSKQLKARTGSYEKDGQTKGEYVTVGAILSNDNGEYALLDPSVSLAGILVKQNAEAQAAGKPTRTNVMCSIFDNDNQKQSSQPRQQAQQQPSSNFDDDLDIPF
jgi:hypothetical protein